MQKIIIDTDPGIDDAQAIAFAIAHPDIELIGLTSVFGNACIETTTSNALTLLDLFGRSDIPVAVGAADPLVRARMPAPDFVHGSDGLGNLHLEPSSRRPTAKSAAEFIVSQANQQPGEITLVAIGPLTNIALAVELDPLLPRKVKELIIMGGTVHEPGNVTPLAEANFINDPHAADKLFEHDWPTKLIGLDVTHRNVLTDTELKILRDQPGDIGKFLWQSSRFYIDFYSKNAQRPMNVSEPACPMHDATAVVYLVENSSFEFTSGASRVACDGLAIGQLAMDHAGGTYVVPYWDNRPKIEAAMQINDTKVRQTFLNTLIEYSQS